MSHVATRIRETRKALLLLLASVVTAGCTTVDTVSYVEPVMEPAARPAAAPATRRARVFVLNAGLLPGMLGSNNVERARRIAWRVKAPPMPDVVVLLEVFDEPSRALLVRELRHTHPWIVSRSGGGAMLPEDSGLLLASRLPVVHNGKPRIGFKAFRERGPITRADHWTTKGVLGAELDLGAGRSLCLLATHLMADYEVMGQYAHVRRRQLEEVRAFGQAFVAHAPPTRRITTILVGDLNVPAEFATPHGFGVAATIRPTNEYAGMKELLLGPRDLYRESNPGRVGFTWNMDPHAPGADPKLGAWRVDYALRLPALTPAHRRDVSQFVKVRTVAMARGVTDHRGLELELGPRTPPASTPIASLPVVQAEAGPAASTPGLAAPRIVREARVERVVSPTPSTGLAQL